MHSGPVAPRAAVCGFEAASLETRILPLTGPRRGISRSRLEHRQHEIEILNRMLKRPIRERQAGLNNIGLTREAAETLIAAEPNLGTAAQCWFGEGSVSS